MLGQLEGFLRVHSSDCPAGSSPKKRKELSSLVGGEETQWGKLSAGLAAPETQRRSKRGGLFGKLNVSDLRRAIVLNEVLQPPLALREQHSSL